MRFTWLYFLGLILSGCGMANMISMNQSLCEKEYEKFEDVVSCTKEAYKNQHLARDSESTKLYFLKGDLLVEKLKKGEITELDARTQWQELFVEMKKGHGSTVVTPYQPYQRPRYCAPSGNGVICY
jgi:hypothetical protein